MFSYFNWNTEERGLFFFQVFSLSFPSRFNNVPFLINFFTDLAVQIIDSICFSITNGESEVTGLSMFLDSMIRYLAKFS